MRFSHLALPLALASLAAAPALAQQTNQPPSAAAPGSLATPQAQASYVIGLNIGSSMSGDGLVIDDPAAFLNGIKDALAKAKPAMSDDKINAVIAQVQADVVGRRNEKIVQQARTNKTEGDAFLKANAAKPGVVTLASGLQYQIVTPGTGPKPKASDTVMCNYRGTLIDGTEFDSSAEHGGPASFPVTGVIPGWTEALQLMPVGSKWRLFIPSDLAYGADSPSSDIGPNAVLLFDIELVSIEKS